MGGGFPETIFDNYVVDNDDKDNELSWSLEVGPAAKSNKREATWSDEDDNSYDLYHIAFHGPEKYCHSHPILL